MSQANLDCIGLPCPQPVLRVKDALAEGARHIEVVVDNDASRNNILRFARNQGHEAVSSDRPGGCYAITITAIGDAPAQPFDASDYPCELPNSPRMVYVIASDSMGRGSDELGWALLQNYVKTLRELSPLPSRIFFYNGGVKIVATDNKAVEAVIEMERRGVEIWACGTCLEYFHLEKELKVGRITNMFDIVNTMATAARVISPY